jgi:hypothetical protein
MLGVDVAVGVAVPPGVGVAVGVTVGVGLGLAVTVDVGVAVAVAVGVGLGGGPDCAQYLPPVFKNRLWLELYPPQTIISLPVHTAVCCSRAKGALAMLVAVQLSMPGLYLPPVLKSIAGQQKMPPQTIISLPVHTAA